MKVAIAKATAEGEMVTVEVSDGDALDVEAAFRLLDERMLLMNGRILAGMKLQRTYPPAVQKAVMDVISVVLGRTSLADVLKVTHDPVAAEGYLEYQAQQDDAHARQNASATAARDGTTREGSA